MKWLIPQLTVLKGKCYLITGSDEDAKNMVLKIMAGLYQHNSQSGIISFSGLDINGIRKTVEGDKEKDILFIL